MIERKFVVQKMKEHQVEEFVAQNLRNVGHSHTKIQRTPLGDKIIIYASRPGLIVGRKGQNIKALTKTLKQKFELNNPEIEIAEVENPQMDPRIMAERIVDSMEHFGTARFKGIAHVVMSDIMKAGALGVEILISGKIPSARAKSWRFYQGYIKKSGDIALTSVRVAYASAQLKSGTVGIIVKIMPSIISLPDTITLKKSQVEIPKEQPQVEITDGKNEGPKE